MMGDVSTHAEIMAFTAAQSRRDIGDSDIPEADYTYMELGNFLTDLSQFRDPVAFHAAREQALREIIAEHGRRAMFGGWARTWANAVFGTRSGRRHGELAEFLADLMRGAVHLFFDDDGLPSLGPALGLLGSRRPPLLLIHGIPPAQVSRVLGIHYTQYYPHEHLDFLPPNRPLSVHRSDRLYQRGRRGVIGYLDRYIQYLAESLSQLEDRWVRARAGRLTSQQRRDFLVELGHLMHPVEDYFFHSNLPEIYQWQIVRGFHPRADPEVEAGLRVLVNNSLAGTALNARSVHLRRKLYRRLRYPVWDRRQQPARTSEDASDLAYTGGFGQSDVWHTLGGALESFEPPLALLPSHLDPRNTQLVLFRLLLSRRERELMVSRDTSEDLMDEHRDQLRRGDYITAIDDWQARGLVCRHAADRFRAAFARDLRAANDHGGWKWDFPGPGGVLITMLNLMQTERTAATQVLARLNGNTDSMYETATDNGSGEEVIGTHTLMSKDSTDKEPMRPEAVALAKHASAGVATELLRRVYSPTPADHGIDWLSLLQYYIRGPARRSGTWEGELITRVRGGGFRQPDPADLAEQPDVRLLGPGHGPDLLRSLRGGTTKDDLEAYYRRFETDP